MSHTKIKHEGVVVDFREEYALVKIMVLSACASCHAKGVCSAADMAEKVVETIPLDKVEKGDKVMVEMEEKLGFKAVVFAFLIRFILLMITVFSVSYFTGSETAAAFSGLGVLVPYYIVIYLLKDYFRRNFIFNCTKINISE
jgi:sigma-E factor negative regulatory protein RseC